MGDEHKNEKRDENEYQTSKALGAREQRPARHEETSGKEDQG